MIRILLILVFAVVITWSILNIQKLLSNTSSKEHETNEQKPFKESQAKTELNYWYTHPHYKILPSGKKVNIAEYLTYEEYKNMNNQQLTLFLHNLYNELSEEEYWNYWKNNVNKNSNDCYNISYIY